MGSVPPLLGATARALRHTRRLLPASHQVTCNTQLNQCAFFGVGNLAEDNAHGTVLRLNHPWVSASCKQLPRRSLQVHYSGIGLPAQEFPRLLAPAT